MAFFDKKYEKAQGSDDGLLWLWERLNE